MKRESSMTVSCTACKWKINSPAGIPDVASHASWGATAGQQHIDEAKGHEDACVLLIIRWDPDKKGSE